MAPPNSICFQLSQGYILMAGFREAKTDGKIAIEHPEMTYPVEKLRCDAD